VSGAPITSEILRLIATNLTEMVMAYDMTRKLVFVNPAVETLTGYTTRELEQENFICWIHPEDQARMLTLWDLLYQGRPYHDEEYRLITKDGRVKWALSSWTPIVDESGRQVGVQGREWDITARKLAETAQQHADQSLHQDEHRYRGLFESSPFPMWEEDFSAVKQYLDDLRAQGVTDIPAHLRNHRPAVEECLRRVRILDVNRAARSFYGAETKEQLLSGLEWMMDEAAFVVIREEMAALAGGRTSFQTDFSVQTLRGEERLVDMIVSIVDSARQDWSRVIVSFFDITDRKRLEEQFVQAQKMESLGRLAGGIAHDFNNLLTVINGYTEWMLQEIAADHPLHGRLSDVRSAGERCAELTQQLLAFSRKQVAQRGPLDLNQVVCEAQGVLRRLMGDDVRVETCLAENLAIIDADRGQMHQVLMNLAANAREAMPAGGALTISTSNLNGCGEVLLEIRDTGFGMDEGTRQRVFEPFFTTKRSANNTGLGLAIVFGIVNATGGRIEAHSHLGEGAAFRIYLPQSRQPQAVPPMPAQASAPSGSGLVLVVDDREEVRALACAMLNQLGYRTLAAGSGQEALSIARRHETPIPLLLTDVLMPGMNGRELAEEFRRRYSGTKIMFMSGYTDRTLSGSGTLEPGTFYLQKPFTMAQLADFLASVEQS
jgi:two-component system cell cycle sensor histidine kinase/response regulator CckA